MLISVDMSKERRILATVTTPGSFNNSQPNTYRYVFALLNYNNFTETFLRFSSGVLGSAVFHVNEFLN